MTFENLNAKLDILNRYLIQVRKNAVVNVKFYNLIDKKTVEVRFKNITDKKIKQIK
jgi:hypothetical protein